MSSSPHSSPTSDHVNGQPITKRICIFSDGTWQSNETNTATNIRRLSMAVLPIGTDGKPQISLYDAGVGTQFNSPTDVIFGGALGHGIDENIIQLYSFLSLNYNHGDEVYMFGYSRGAYTVRSLIGLINHAGLVKRNHIDFADEAYKLYRRNPGVDSDEAIKFRKCHGDAIPIKCLVCFDTVGSLGIPQLFPAFFQRAFTKKYEFHDTKLSHNIEYAIHAVSIEEWRGAFLPTLMQPCDEHHAEQVREFCCWGDHAGVGGGDEAKAQSAYCALNAVLSAMDQRRLPLTIDRRLIPSFDIKAPSPRINLLAAGEYIMFGLLNIFTGSGVREIKSVKSLHESAIRRYKQVSTWRPEALKPLSQEIMDFGN